MQYIIYCSERSHFVALTEFLQSNMWYYNSLTLTLKILLLLLLYKTFDIHSFVLDLFWIGCFCVPYFHVLQPSPFSSDMHFILTLKYCCTNFSIHDYILWFSLYSKLYIYCIGNKLLSNLEYLKRGDIGFTLSTKSYKKLSFFEDQGQ